MDLTKSWKNYPIVAFDTETSGAYPVGFDIVEFGAVKYLNGEVVDKLQMFLKPRETMSDFIIGIHGITNEMVKDAPEMKDQILKIHQFLEGSILMAHHAPFDLGFLIYDYERFGMSIPHFPVFCTSLLSRKYIHETENHKLQTLVKYLGFDGGAAHRAYDDANSCLHVGLHCLNKIGEDASVEKVLKIQGKSLACSNYSIKGLSSVVDQIESAIWNKKNLEMCYEKNIPVSKKGIALSSEVRQVTPIGVVRNPDGDYMQALCLRDKTAKRFYLSKIKDAQMLY